MPTRPPEATPERFLQLIADPQRWRLLAELASSDRRVGELTDLVGRPQSLVSYHLGQLRAAGLVTSRRSAADGRDTYYRLDAARCASVLAGAGTALHPGIRLAVVPPQPGRPAGTGRRKQRVLFLCTGNSARSQMAEALLTHRSGGAVEARSAGSHPKALHPNAVRAMAERGIDIAGRPTTHLDRFARRRFDHVVTLCDKVKEICPQLPGQPTTRHWSMPDPSTSGPTLEANYPAFIEAADEIEVRVDLLLAELLAGADHQRSTHARR